MYSPPCFPPLYFVKRGNLLIYNALRPLFAKQRGGRPLKNCLAGNFREERACRAENRVSSFRNKVKSDIF